MEFVDASPADRQANERERIGRGRRGSAVKERNANENEAEIGLRNRAGYCIFDRVLPVEWSPRLVTVRGFAIGLNY